MRAVGGTEAVIAEETVRRDEIDVFVGLHPGSDLGLTGLLLGGLVASASSLKLRLSLRIV